MEVKENLKRSSLWSTRNLRPNDKGQFSGAETSYPWGNVMLQRANCNFNNDDAARHRVCDYSSHNLDLFPTT